VLTVGIKLGVVAGLAYAALVGSREVYEYATTSSRFELQSFVFEPTQHVSDAHLRELLAVEPGTNILAVDLNAMGAAVADDPWVAEATVVRHLPDTLEVHIREHEAAAVGLAGYFYLLDDEGTPFKRLERGERGQLPMITGIDRSLLLEDPDAAALRFGEGLAVLRTYESKRRPRLGEVHLDDDGSVTLYTESSGTQLRLGRSDVSRGLERYDALRVALGARADRLAVVHLDAPRNPDHRERVVARFYSEQDEAVLLAHAESTRDAVRTKKQEDEFERSEDKPREPKKSRIPRYE
jgi:cell division protein FtsQ